MDMCVDMWAVMGMDMCVDICTDMRADMCTDIDLCIGMYEENKA